MGWKDYEAELTGGFDVTSLDALGFYDELSPQLIPSSIGLSAVMYEGEASRTVEIEPALRSLLFMTVDEIQLNDKNLHAGLFRESVLMKLQLRQKCSDCGQTITEYVLMLGLTLGVLVISVLFLGVFQEWAVADSAADRHGISVSWPANSYELCKILSIYV